MGYNNLNCTHTNPESWQCTNGVVCPSTVYSSSFSIVQSNETILQIQNVSVNGTNFVVHQGGTGNATVLSGTSSVTPSIPIATTTTTNLAKSTSISPAPHETSTSKADVLATVASTTTPTSITATTISSTPKVGSSPHQLSFSGSLLVVMFILATIATQVSAINPATIGEDVEAVLTVLIDTVKSVQIGQTDIAGAFDGVAKMICGTLVGSAVNILAGVPEALVQCEEAMASSEASLIGSALSVGLGSYTGIGGILLEGLTAVGEAATVTVDAGVLAELFIVNSPLGGILVAALAQSVDFASDDLCGAVESAAAGTAAGKGSTAPLQSTSAISTLTSNSSTSSSTTSSPPITTTSAPSSLATSSPIPDVSNDACAACELSLYFIGVQGLASKCNVAVPLGVGSDLSVFFCDSSFNRKYAPFCNYLCANQCVTYNIQSWIQGASNQFWSSASLPLCNQECPGFEGDGRCQGGDHCPCAQGSDTCVPC